MVTTEPELPRRLRPSDSLTLSCDCQSSGLVLLFYGYASLDQPTKFAGVEYELLNTLGVTGKVRLSREGFNITVGGPLRGIMQYVSVWGHRLGKFGTVMNQTYAQELQQTYPTCPLGLELVELVAPSPYHLVKGAVSKYTTDQDNLTLDLAKLWLEKDNFTLGLPTGLSTAGSEFWTPLKVQFFKPSPGCRHVFGGLSVKVVEEICPLGVPSHIWQPELGWSTCNPLPVLKKSSSTCDNYEVSFNNNDNTQFLRYKVTPSEFNHLLEDSLSTSEPIEPEYLVLDVRNYYESELGKFEGATCPPIRNFKALPSYCQDNLAMFAGKKVVTYCTGGIRCEKATAYLRDFIQPKLVERELQPIKAVFMLEGGIHNYLAWCNQSGKLGKECHFRGRNYVFDARQSMSLTDASAHTLSLNTTSTTEHGCITKCGHCDAPSGYLYKCISPQCHKIIIRCPPSHTKPVPPQPSPCYTSLPNCCTDCKSKSTLPKSSKRSLCQCERHRLDCLNNKSPYHPV